MLSWVHVRLICVLGCQISCLFLQRANSMQHDKDLV